MLGLILGFVFLTLGLYLTGSAIWRKLRCRYFITATVALGGNQAVLQEGGDTKKTRFPKYSFSLHGRSYLVIDYNAPRSCQLRAGDPVQIFVDEVHPDRCWYPVGGLWKDAAWGIASLVFAGLTALLFFI